MANGWPSERELRGRMTTLADSLAEGAFPFVAEWTGTAYRFATRPFADCVRFTDGEGARQHGGRFTPIGAHRTVYLSLDRATATAELDSWYEYYGVPDGAFKPRVLAAVAVSARLVLDLTAAGSLAFLELARELVFEDWRSISDTGGVARTQTLGRVIYEAGFEGILFPSTRRPDGVNMALFPDNYLDGSHARMLNAD